MEKAEAKRFGEKVTRLHATVELLHKRLDMMFANQLTIINGLNQILPEPIHFRDNIPDDLMDYKQASEFLNISTSQIGQLSKDGKIPFIIANGKRQYSKRELEKWIIARPKHKKMTL